MNKQDAFLQMKEGKKITNRYFAAGEYLWINSDRDWVEENSDQILTEDNYPFTTYWDSNYLPDIEWEIYND